MLCKFFKKEREDNPILQYIIKQSLSDQQKILKKLRHFKQFGHYCFLRTGDSKVLDRENRIFELRIKKYRITYSFIDDTCWVLHIFKKKTRKTPKQEIKHAKNIKKYIINSTKI